MQTRMLPSLVVLFAVSSTGCTAVGAGIGAAIPRWETTTSSGVGRTVRVTTADGARAQGTIIETNEEVVTLEDRAYHRSVVRSADVVRAEEERGSYIHVGALIGAAVDIALATFLIVRVAEGSSGGVGFVSFSGYQGGLAYR